MQRATVPEFIGGFDQLRNRQINATGLWNGLLESTGSGKAQKGYIRKAPGVKPFFTVPGASSVRGLFQQDDRAFVVAGRTCAEFDVDGNLIHSYTVLEDDNPASMVSNGGLTDTKTVSQLLVVSGGDGIVIDLLTNTQVPITAPSLTPPYSQCIYIDGYGVILKTDTIQFNFSAL